MRRIKLWVLALVALLAVGCAGKPPGVEPVQPFDLQRYLGTWYEIARLDHSFERGMDRVTANYSLRDDGSVRVINRGYVTAEDEWKEAEGRAVFADDPDTGHLKVSFFGPFYGAYIVFELDQEGYQYALVSGASYDWLWLLSRTPDPDPELVERLLQRASEAGFDTSELIYPSHVASSGAK